MGKHAEKPKLYLRGRVYWTWFHDRDGTVRYESTKCRDEKAAEKRAREIEREGPTRVDSDRKMRTLGAACESMLADLRRNRSPATVRVQTQRTGHLQRILGKGRKIAALNREHLTKYWDTRAAEPKCSASTRAAELETLRSVLRHEYDNDRYDGDVRRIWPKLLVEGAHVARHDRLDLSQLQAVLAVADASRASHRADYLRAYVMTGARCSELYKLRAKDLDHVNKRVHVIATKTARKSDWGDRWVPVLDPATWAMLVRRSEEARGGPLFPDWSGSWMTFKLWARKAKLVDDEGQEMEFSHNSLRRTFCTVMASAGVPPLVCARLLGHADTAMVMRVYAGLDNAAYRSAVGHLPNLAPLPRLPAEASAGL